MRFERTFDFELVRSVVTHPAIYPYLTNDGGAPAEAFELPRSEWNWYVLVYDGDTLLGLFWLVPYNAVCWEAHTALLPGFRGGRAIRAYREGLAWIFQNSPCKKIIGNIPEYNRAALVVALRGGARIIGTNTKSVQRGGRLLDQVIVGKGIED